MAGTLGRLFAVLMGLVLLVVAVSVVGFKLFGAPRLASAQGPDTPIVHGVMDEVMARVNGPLEAAVAPFQVGPGRLDDGRFLSCGDWLDGPRIDDYRYFSVARPDLAAASEQLLADLLGQLEADGWSMGGVMPFASTGSFSLRGTRTLPLNDGSSQSVEIAVSLMSTPATLQVNVGFPDLEESTCS